MLSVGKCEALQAVNETGFVVQELILYLDTHPGCARAWPAINRQKRRIVRQWRPMLRSMGRCWRNRPTPAAAGSG